MSQVGRQRESLIAELREIERMDADYYRQQGSGRGDVSAYRLRQKRRRQILVQLADNDLRRHSRISLSIDVTLFSVTQGRIPGRTSDISESGFAATLPLELPVGEVVRAEIHLPFGTKVVQAVVRNRNALRHGFEFLGTDLSDEVKGLDVVNIADGFRTATSASTLRASFGLQLGKSQLFLSR